MAQRAEWVDRMRSATVLEVARELGLPMAPARGASGGALYHCPACDAERRHAKSRDKRGAVGVRRDGFGWRCFQCDASGDALDLVALALEGRRLPDLHDTGKANVREWCVRWLGLEAGTPSSPRPRPLARPAPVVEPEPTYPPAAEVAALWAACVPVTDDAEVAAWLAEQRKIAPDEVAFRDLARALPRDARVPEWASIGGRAWSTTGHRLVVPMVDVGGEVRSLLARRVPNPTAEGERKSIAPKGYGRAGLVMANGGARFLLCSAMPEMRDLRVVVAEGETDWLVWTTRYDLPVLGMVSGSWSTDIAARIPNGATVVVATDADAEGDRYYAKIMGTLAERWNAGSVHVERWKP